MNQEKFGIKITFFPISEKTLTANMFLLSALLDILIGVVLSNVCRNAPRKSY